MRTSEARWGFLALALAATAALADEPAKQAESPKPATHAMKKVPFRTDLSLEGVLEAQEMGEVAYRPDAWGELRILKGLPLGSLVKAGEPLVTPDTRAIDEAIQDLEGETALAAQALKHAEEELPILERLAPLELTAAERAKVYAEEDLKRHHEVDRDREIKQTDMGLKVAQFYLESAQEELSQLEKMYKADEVTEETEEIILKRQRLMVDHSKLGLEDAKIVHGQFMGIFLPRQDARLALDAQQLALALERAKTLTPLQLSMKRLEFLKMKLAGARASDRLVKLRRDREGMTLKAPADGVLYYGRCDRGKWSADDATAQAMQRGGALATQQVVLTVVKPRPLFLRASVPEKELHAVPAGLKGKAVPAGFPDLRLPVSVEAVTSLPVEAGAYGARLAIELPPDGKALVPGMSCAASFVTYQAKAALTAPAKAVFPDELDDEKRFVYVFKAGAAPERRAVTVGRKGAETVEIIEGLAEGEEILLEKPQDASP